MIQINGVSRCFGENKAVNEVSFAIEQGEIVGLLGHNGAGKTTLMKMITGFLEPSSGNIHINGKIVEGSVTEGQENIGYLPESLPVYPEMTVIDYLDYAAELRGVPKEQHAEQIRDVIAKTELQDRAFQTIGTLSRGYQQRVGVAQALLNNPKILILDEPTNGLDPSQIQHMRSLITSLKQHATVIVSTHILQEVKAMCDRVIILNQGAVALDSSMEKLINNNQLILKTNCDLSSVQSKLKSVSSVEKISPISADAGRHQYKLEINSTSNIEDCIADVARTLSKSDADIYQLERVQFDLETVFHDMSKGVDINNQQQGGLENAA